MQATFQTRLLLDPSVVELLDRWGVLYGRIERQLFAAYCAAGYSVKAVEATKAALCREHQMTSRQFNAVWRLLKGKIASKAEVDRLALEQVRSNLKAVRASLRKLDRQKAPLSAKQVQSREGKKRRLAKLVRRQTELARGHVALCFGSRKLFRAQFALEANGFESLDQWRAAWRAARNNAFYLLGSKDESAGNQSCTAAVADNGTLTLRLRLPEPLAAVRGHKHLVLNNIWFEHGQLELYDALAAGQAVSYRFLKDAKGWRVFASTERVDTRKPFDPALGVVGVDINAEHLALAETDRFGNLVALQRIACVTQGKSAGQRQAAVREAAKAAVAYAARVDKPLVHERLDFSRRKHELKSTGGPRYARALSSFAYGAALQALQSNALLQTVATYEVNPAYTSVIGRVKYAKSLGVTVHQAAALAIGRRGMGYGERAPRRPAVPDGKGDYLVVELPARNRSMHAWAHWARVHSQLSETLAGWHRLRALAARQDAREAQAARASGRGLSGTGAVRVRPSNRQPDRSAGVDRTVVHRN